MQRVPWITQGGPNFNTIRVLIRGRQDSHTGKDIRTKAAIKRQEDTLLLALKMEEGAVAQQCTWDPQGNKSLA